MPELGYVYVLINPSMDGLVKVGLRSEWSVGDSNP